MMDYRDKLAILAEAPLEPLEPFIDKYQDTGDIQELVAELRHRANSGMVEISQVYRQFEESVRNDVSNNSITGSYGHGLGDIRAIGNSVYMIRNTADYLPRYAHSISPDPNWRTMSWMPAKGVPSGRDPRQMKMNERLESFVYAVEQANRTIKRKKQNINQELNIMASDGRNYSSLSVLQKFIRLVDEYIVDIRHMCRLIQYAVLRTRKKLPRRPQ